MEITEQQLAEALDGFGIDIHDDGFLAAGIVDRPAEVARALFARLASQRLREPGGPAGIQVTVTDLENGDTETKVITNDYVITTAGDYYVAHRQAYANGTHVITIKRGARA